MSANLAATIRRWVRISQVIAQAPGGISSVLVGNSLVSPVSPHRLRQRKSVSETKRLSKTKTAQ